MCSPELLLHWNGWKFDRGISKRKLGLKNSMVDRKVVHKCHVVTCYNFVNIFLSMLAFSTC